MDFELLYDDEEEEDPVESAPIPVEGYTLMICADGHEPVAWRDSRAQCWFCDGAGELKVKD